MATDAPDGIAPTAADGSRDLPLSDQPIFRALLGPAGTGKSTLIRQWVAEAEPGQVILCTTTGIAAVNLGDATTIHSLLGFFDLASLEEKFYAGYLQARLRQLMQAGLEHLVLDEVSMLEGAHLTLLVRAIEEVNGSAAVLRGDQPPLHLTVVGDFCHLPPVGDKGKPRSQRVKPGFAFESPEWAKFEQGGVQVLSKVWRQSDPLFLGALMGLRKGDAAGMEDLCALDWQAKTDMRWEGTTVFAVNEQVDRYNALRHDALDTTPVSFASLRDGKQRGEWKQIPGELALKPGALVMVLANKRDDPEDPRSSLTYANGDLGYFRGASGKGAQVELLRGDTVLVSKVKRLVEEPTGATGKRKDAYRTIGWIEYVPLRLAYGSTVHKSQGLTLDSVQINLRDPFWKHGGMAYVGLSRCRSYQGLRLVGEAGLLGKLARTDPRVARFA